MIPTLFFDQEVIQTQEQSITELLKAVREQSDQLNHQRAKIKNLEEKVNVGEVNRGGERVCSIFLTQNHAVGSVIVKKTKNKRRNQCPTPHPSHFHIVLTQSIGF